MLVLPRVLLTAVAAATPLLGTQANTPHLPGTDRHPLLRGAVPAGVTITALWPDLTDPTAPNTSTHGKPGLGQLGDGLLLAISGGIADYRCFGGAMVKRSTDGGRSWGQHICAIPADWQEKVGEGWYVHPRVFSTVEKTRGTPYTKQSTTLMYSPKRMYISWTL